jgi:aryl-alcohol dehydrogenase-like predicted oxidoreductase
MPGRWERRKAAFIKRALEAGINFFDTVNRYSLGSNEEIFGRAVADSGLNLPGADR